MYSNLASICHSLTLHHMVGQLTLIVTYPQTRPELAIANGYICDHLGVIVLINMRTLCLIPYFFYMIKYFCFV